MLQYIIKTFRGGTSDENDKGVVGSFKYGYGLNIHGRDDVLVCNQAMTTESESVVSDLIKYFVTASDGTTYCFGSTGSIYARSGAGVYNFAYNDTNGEIKGASEWKLSDGNNYLFWATNTSLARVAINGSLPVPWGAGVATQDYKTTLESASSHHMKVASGSMIIANGNYIAEVDYDGNYTAQRMNVRPGNLIKCVDERDDYTILGSGRADGSEEGHIWSWLSTASNYIQKKKIPVKGVNAFIDTEARFLQGGDEGEIFFADFESPVAVHKVPGGGQVNPSGVAIYDGLAMFGFYGGDYTGLWSYGRKIKNRPFALNYDYRLAPTVRGSTIAEIGAITVTDGTLLASWKTTDGSTTDFGVDRVDTTTKAFANYEGLEFDGGKPFLKKKIDTVKLVLSPMPDTTSVAVKYKINKESDWQYAMTGSGATTYAVTNASEAEFSIGKPALLYEVGVELTPSGNQSPEVQSITTHLPKEGYDH